jgi:hypothetical protein
MKNKWNFDLPLHLPALLLNAIAPPGE